MGRRSSKDGGVAGTPDFDTVGMTILPGHPLPAWAEPPADEAASQAAEESWPPESLEAFAAMAAAQAAAQQPAAPSPATAPAPAAEAPHEALVAAAMATAGVTAGFAAAESLVPGQPGGGYGPTTAPAGHGAPATGPAGPAAAGFPQPSAPHYGQAPIPPSTVAPPAPAVPAQSGPSAGLPQAGVPAGTPGAGMPPTTGGFPAGTFGAPHPTAATVTGPATVAGAAMAAGVMAAGHDPAMASPAGAAMAQASQAPNGHPAPAAPHGQHPGMSQQPPAAGGPGAPVESGHGATMTATLPGPAEAPPAAGTPSEGWNSPDRPQLSPEHVALLTWWADMIAKGQFPAPPGVTAEEAVAVPQQRKLKQPKPHRTDGSSRGVLVGVGLAVVAAAGLAVAFGPGLVGGLLGDDPEPVPATELTMPAAVGDLVAVTGPEVGTQLQALIGFGLRPAGVTVTAGYGTDPSSPVVLGAVATTVAPAADATGQLNEWAQDNGAELGELVPGTGASSGVTCAAVPETETTPAGSMCIWSATGMNGRTFAVSTDPAAALERTTELRAAM